MASGGSPGNEGTNDFGGMCLVASIDGVQLVITMNYVEDVAGFNIVSTLT